MLVNSVLEGAAAYLKTANQMPQGVPRRLKCQPACVHMDRCSQSVWVAMRGMD
jgi:hypothetical protein